MKLHEISISQDYKRVVDWLHIQGLHVTPINAINRECVINYDFSVDVYNHNVYLRDHVAICGMEFDVKFRYVDGDFNAADNNFTNSDLKRFCPEQCENLNLSGNKLTSFDGIGKCMRLVLSDNQLTSFDGCPKGLDGLNVCHNKITSFVGIAKHLELSESGAGLLAFDMTVIKDGGIGLILVPGLKLLSGTDRLSGTDNMNNILTPYGPWKIIQKYLGKHDEIFECQQELIEAGFEEYAKL